MKIEEKKFKVIKVYEESEAPKNAEFWYRAVQKYGVLSIDVPDYKLLEPGQRYVYFYKVYPDIK